MSPKPMKLLLSRSPMSVRLVGALAMTLAIAPVSSAWALGQGALAVGKAAADMGLQVTTVASRHHGRRCGTRCLRQADPRRHIR
jgi:hypothetical protein